LLHVWSVRSFYDAMPGQNRSHSATSWQDSPFHFVPGVCFFGGRANFQVWCCKVYCGFVARSGSPLWWRQFLEPLLHGLLMVGDKNGEAKIQSLYYCENQIKCSGRPDPHDRLQRPTMRGTATGCLAQQARLTLDVICIFFLLAAFGCQARWSPCCGFLLFPVGRGGSSLTRRW